MWRIYIIRIFFIIFLITIGLFTSSLVGEESNKTSKASQVSGASKDSSNKDSGNKDSSNQKLSIQFGHTTFKNFSHKTHGKLFKKMKVGCQDCHSFRYRAKKRNRLTKSVELSLLHPPKEVCHTCHLDARSASGLNSCLLCHSKADKIKPPDHKIGWNARHGSLAEFNQDSCLRCHRRNDCSGCHNQKKKFYARVHTGSIRFTHSIEASAKPYSCIQCHRSKQFCLDCHTERR